MVQGGTDRQGRAFVNAATSTYYAAEADDIASALVTGMRQASYSVAVAAGPSEASTSVGATGAVIADRVVYIAQIMPTQVYILRNGVINALPDERDFDADFQSDLDVEQEIDLFRAQLEAGDCLVLASTDLRHELTEREILGMLRRPLRPGSSPRHVRAHRTAWGAALRGPGGANQGSCCPPRHRRCRDPTRPR